MLHSGAKVGIVCCSDGVKREDSGKIRQLEEVLKSMGLRPVRSACIYAQQDVFSGTARERAQALMDFYLDDETEAIFDISGGDIANGILPYLDYDVIAGSRKLFWGYSDLTTVINAIYAKTGRPSVLYQVRNLTGRHGERQSREFQNTVLCHGDDLFRFEYAYRTGTESAGGLLQDGKDRFPRGVVAGGNIRCFLKLAGTEYMPDLQDKILLLESYSGTAARMETYLCQLEQLGVFRKVAGILLGTFTQMQEQCPDISMETLVRKFAGEDMPIAVTGQIGHGSDSKGIVIGREFPGLTS